MISGKGIAADAKKIKAAQQIKPPRTIKELQRFVGMTGY